jgi:hypothetical protein
LERKKISGVNHRTGDPRINETFTHMVPEFLPGHLYPCRLLRLARRTKSRGARFPTTTKQARENYFTIAKIHARSYYRPMKTQILLLSLILAGCSSDPMNPKFHVGGGVQTAQYDSIKRAPKESVDVFQPGDTLPKHRVFAMLQTNGEYRQEAELLIQLVRQARYLGADGLVILPENTIAEKGVRVGQLSGSTTGTINPNSRRSYRAHAILYQKEAP